MNTGKLFSLDRIEGDCAVLLDDNDVRCIVALSDLTIGACEGTMYRQVGETFIEDADATRERRERIRALQNRLRQRNN